MTDMTVKEQRAAGLVPPATFPSESPRRMRLTTSSPTLSDVQNVLFAMQDRFDALGTAVSRIASIVSMQLRSRSVALGLEDGSGDILDEDGSQLMLEPSTPATVINGDHVLLEDGWDLLDEEGYALLMEGESSPGYTSKPVSGVGGGPSDTITDPDVEPDYQEIASDIADVWNPYSSQSGGGGTNTQT